MRIKQVKADGVEGEQSGAMINITVCYRSQEAVGSLIQGLALFVFVSLGHSTQLGTQ